MSALRCAPLRPGLGANTGGPMSRTRRQPLRASLLEPGNGPLRFAPCTTVGLEFGTRDPLQVVESAMRRLRVAEPEALRRHYALPGEACLCRENLRLEVPRASDLGAKELLRHALLLGLCTAHHYDPARPVLFTRAALLRRLELYLARGFYA